MSHPFRNCPVSCPIAASAQQPRTWLSWTLSATITALILSAASALALTSTLAPILDQPIFLTLPPAPAAAESVAAISDPAPLASAEAPSQTAAAAPEVDTPPDISEPQPAAKPIPPEMAKPEQLADAKPAMDAPPQPPDPQPAPDAPPAAAKPPSPAPKPPEATKPKVEKAEAKPKKAEKKPTKTKKTDEPAPKKTAKASSAPPNAGGAMAASKAAKATAQRQSPATYQKAVMKKIRGTKKGSNPGKGSAVVGFAISAGGGLSLVKIVKSSGSPALDAAAVDHIQRSAPFGPPPAGVSTRFSFEFVGK
ncbi:energy transducer TonB family protein [Cypionkella psychrotolerans]|uniref:energy transducer TonB family protein n=1 Tax=Cypionkella psychrotolerans TaxID=1678131 RepID=UPI0006B4056E|nr:energy transducer TonB [Cypionkella psychrotolerans]